MATLHKFKMLATQCAVTGSPTRSPSTSPVIQLRRRKTLRMLLSRGGGGGSRRLPTTDEFVDRRGSDVDSSEDEKDNSARRKLKDLFVSSSSSPPFEESGRDDDEEETNRWRGDDVDLIERRGGSRGLRHFPGMLRQRLLRRAWRPVLVTIPE